MKRIGIKPESTAPIMRAYIENNLFDDPQPVFLYYVEPHYMIDSQNEDTDNFFKFELKLFENLTLY